MDFSANTRMNSTQSTLVDSGVLKRLFQSFVGTPLFFSFFFIFLSSPSIPTL